MTLKPGAKLPLEFNRYARAGALKLINGHVVDLPNRLLARLAAHADVFDVHYNRPIFKHNFRTSLTIGALAVQRVYGVTGAGIGVAVVDSGISTWHDDLTNHTTALYPYGDQRVSAFVDFVHGGGGAPHDDNGHGTHVAGIIAGNGEDSLGQKSGMAPDASLVSLKVLDSNGLGTISSMIQALDWVVAHRTTYNIRVVNLSVGASILESYWTDPLTLAAKRTVDAGVVVVAAAGNMGKNALGQTQYGGITAPGNAPWVLTVGASSTQGTPARGDDVIAGYSSRGPTFIDYAAKPDLVAPGTGTVSLAAPGSLFYSTKASALIPGSGPTGFAPYLSLSGTSMAAPVVSGTVALMLQANPSLTPNAVKAILMYTAQQRDGYNGLIEGAGFLNTLGAVRLASFYATAQPGQPVPIQKMWSKHILWGNHMLSGGFLNPAANAYGLGVNWGVAQDDDGDNIVWGSNCTDDECANTVWGNADGDDIIWSSSCVDAGCTNVVWGTDDEGKDNIVWGSDCGGADCTDVIWGDTDPIDHIVWGTGKDGDNIVWGSSARDIIWGSDVCEGDSGGNSGDGPTLCNIVWGSAADGDIAWNNADSDNIQWGSDCDASMGGCSTIVVGSDANGEIVFGEVAIDGTITVVQLDQLTDGQLLKLIVTLALPPPSPPPPVPLPPSPDQDSSEAT